MNYKTMQLKADEAGKISGFFSTYEKTPDSYGDIILPGAFTKTIEKRKESGHPFPLCFNHDFSAVIGACNTVEEKENGPYIEADFLDTQLGQDVRKMVQSGAIYQFSFAYDILKRRDANDEERKNVVMNVLEELDSFVDSHVENLRNIFALVLDFESFAIIAATMAGWTGDINIWEEVHLNFIEAITFTGFAATTLTVETKTAGFVTANFGFWLAGEELTNQVEDASISGWVTAWGAANWTLVNYDTFVEIFDTIDAFVGTRNSLRAVEASKQFVGKN